MSRTTSDASVAPVGRLDALAEVAIDLEVTSVCDAVCGFCPREFMPDKKQFMSMEIVVRLAEELRQQKALLVVLCGIGEPTLHPGLERIVRVLAETGTRIVMTTHGGARMDRARFESLVDQGLSGFNFSLNAMTAQTHQRVMRLKDFDRTVVNLREISDLRNQSFPGVDLNVSLVVCNLNEHEVVDFVDAWRAQQVSRIFLHALNNRNGLLSEDVKPVDLSRFADMYQGDPQVAVDLFGGYVQPGDHLCKIAQRLIFISVDGTMRLCAMDYRRTSSFGNVRERGLQDMHSQKIQSWLRGEFDRFCAGCDFCPSDARYAIAP